MKVCRSTSLAIGLSLILVGSVVFAVSSFSSTPLPSNKDLPWPRLKYDRVVGYQYANPWKLDGLICDGTLFIDRLPALKTQERALTAAQGGQLLQICFERTNHLSGALCHNPHHIFVFYDGEKAVAAIDVCFSCNQIKCLPSVEIGKTTSLPDLQRLCFELGLGIDAPKNEAQVVGKYRQQFGDEVAPKKP